MRTEGVRCGVMQSPFHDGAAFPLPSFSQEIVANAAKVQTALKLSQEDQNTIASLKREIEKAWKMVDAAHEKEGRAKETIQQLKHEIQNLSRLVEQGAGLSIGQENTVNELVKVKTALGKECEAQAVQISSLMADIAGYLLKVDGMEVEVAAANEEMGALREVINARKTDSEKEGARKERLENDLKVAIPRRARTRTTGPACATHPSHPPRARTWLSRCTSPRGATALVHVLRLSDARQGLRATLEARQQEIKDKVTALARAQDGVTRLEILLREGLLTRLDCPTRRKSTLHVGLELRWGFGPAPRVGTGAMHLRACTRVRCEYLCLRPPHARCTVSPVCRGCFARGACLRPWWMRHTLWWMRHSPPSPLPTLADGQPVVEPHSV